MTTWLEEKPAVALAGMVLALAIYITLHSIVYTLQANTGAVAILVQ